MIKNLIFDFGDIFINLDKKATGKALAKYGYTQLTPEIEIIFKQYEQGFITTAEFVKKGTNYFSTATPQNFVDAWNAILLDLPEYRIEFIENLAKEGDYKLFLLSNTNTLHIKHIIETLGEERFNRFKKCFKKFYLSHEMHLIKPNAAIYQFVLNENNLVSTECLFIDDTKENTDAAQKLGIKTWHLQVGKEDIINLKEKL